MRPRPMTAENVDAAVREPRPRPRFNEAAADDRGKLELHPLVWNYRPVLQ